MLPDLQIVSQLGHIAFGRKTFYLFGHIVLLCYSLVVTLVQTIIQRNYWLIELR